MVPLIEFVLTHLPAAPARVLEVGCGEGELARALDAAGYEVTAIDPLAPEGAIFRRIKLEDLEEEARFDAVVAARSFHHMRENLDQNLERAAGALRDGGPLVLEEFAPDRLDAATGEWYEARRRILVAAEGAGDRPGVAEWEEHHASVTPSEELLRALRTRFDEQVLEDVPYLWRYLGGTTSAQLEESLIAAGAIRALGFRFVGIPKPAASLKRA